MGRFSVSAGYGGKIYTNDWQVLPLFGRAGVSEGLIPSFLRACRSGNEHTFKRKDSDLRMFGAFMMTLTGMRLEQMQLCDLTVETISKFLEYRREKGDGPGTLLQRLTSFRALDSWLEKFVFGYPCPSREIKPPKRPRVKYKGMPMSDAERLTATAYTMGETREQRIRNGFILSLMLGTGVRRGEVLGLTERQMERDEKGGLWLRNVRCKDGVYRNVYVLSRCQEAFDAWMPIRAQILESFGILDTRDFPLIITFKKPFAKLPADFGMSPVRLWAFLQSLSEKAGIADVYPHKLRHTRAHEILDSSGDLRLVAQGLGHTSIASAYQYTERPEHEMAARLERSTASK